MRDIDPRLVIERYEDVAKERLYYSYPMLVNGSDFGVYNNNLHNACVALTERYLNLKIDGVLTAPIQPTIGFFDAEELQQFSSRLGRLRAKSHVYSRREVVDMYTGAKRLAYERAMETLVTRKVVKWDACLKTFIKFEKTNIDKAPRIINPRSTEYTLELGRYLKKIEKPVYRKIHLLFKSRADMTIIKGVNIVESARVARQKWERFVNPVAIGGDITKLDMHISVPALEFEHGVYKRIFRSRKLKQLLSWQINNNGKAYFADGSVSFKMKGTRSSGDINTSLGNVIIVTAIIYLWMKREGITMELMNNGDDFVIIIEECDLDKVQRLPDIFYQAGMRLKMEKPVREFEKLEFCQTKPVYDGYVWRMCRVPETILQKDVMCVLPVEKFGVRRWLGAVGECGLSLASGLPVLSSFYRMFLRNGESCSVGLRQLLFKNTAMWEKMHNLGKFHKVITDEARVSFYKAFGILPDQQRILESRFDSIDMDTKVEQYTGLIRDNNIIYGRLW